MEVKGIIVMVVEVALVVIIGFLVIAMVESMLKDGGMVQTFFSETLSAICEKAKSLIATFSAIN